MAQAVSATITVNFVANVTQDIGLANEASAPIAYKKTYTLLDGSGANKVHQLWSSEARSISASSSEALDLSGTLTDAFGNSIALTKVKAIMIKASDSNVNDVVVGGAASNGWISPFGDATDKINVKPGGMLLLVAPDANGLAATASTADQLKVANSSSGSAVVYDIIIVGE